MPFVLNKLNKYEFNFIFSVLKSWIFNIRLESRKLLLRVHFRGTNEFNGKVAHSRLIIFQQLLTAPGFCYRNTEHGNELI